MAEKKRHHYVPQLYLKYFSKDKKNIIVFSIKEKELSQKMLPYVDNVIKTICTVKTNSLKILCLC